MTFCAKFIMKTLPDYCESRCAFSVGLSSLCVAAQSDVRVWQGTLTLPTYEEGASRSLGQIGREDDQWSQNLL
jgi:hypothetical protein